MHRISRQDLLSTIYVLIRTAPRLTLRGLRSKLPQDGDKATGELATRICNAIDNNSRMVIAADMVSTGDHGQRHGKWGIDEPDASA